MTTLIAEISVFQDDFEISSEVWGNERYGSMDSDTFKFVQKQLFTHEDEEDINEGILYAPSRSAVHNNSTQK